MGLLRMMGAVFIEEKYFTYQSVISRVLKEFEEAKRKTKKTVDRFVFIQSYLLSLPSC